MSLVCWSQHRRLIKLLIHSRDKARYDKAISLTILKFYASSAGIYDVVSRHSSSQLGVMTNASAHQRLEPGPGVLEEQFGSV